MYTHYDDTDLFAMFCVFVGIAVLFVLLVVLVTSSGNDNNYLRAPIREAKRECLYRQHTLIGFRAFDVQDKSTLVFSCKDGKLRTLDY